MTVHAGKVTNCLLPDRLVATAPVQYVLLRLSSWQKDKYTVDLNRIPISLCPFSRGKNAYHTCTSADIWVNLHVLKSKLAKVQKEIVSQQPLLPGGDACGDTCSDVKDHIPECTKALKQFALWIFTCWLRHTILFLLDSFDDTQIPVTDTEMFL